MTTPSKSAIIPAVFFGVIGLVCLALGVNDYVHEEAWFAQAVQADGTVTTYDLHVRNDGKSEYCPRIEFTTQAGEPAATYGDICPSKPDKSQIGQPVTVYYDPNDPSDTRSKGWLGVEGTGLIFGLIGFVFFLVIGLIMFLVNRRAAAMRTRRSGTGGLNATLLEDAERYRANQRAAERERKKPDSK